VSAIGEDPAAKGDGASGSRNLALRVLSALILAPLALATAYIGGWPFALFWALAALIVLWEWITLVAGPGHVLMFSSCAAAIAVAAGVEFRDRPIPAILVVGLGLLASLIFAPDRRRLWVAGGIGYAGAMLLAPMFLRFDPDYGLQAVLLLFAIVWTTDVLGYFAGRTFGGPKLCPAISPKKTWSGAVAGTVGAMLVAFGLVHLFEIVFGKFFDPAAWAVIGLVLSVVAQCGDLAESWVKRRFGAKDASQVIPGHGGVMDRLDGFWAAAVAGCIVGILRGGFHNVGLGLLVW
jgi:phosphatidate cytidylyltransferase